MNRSARAVLVLVILSAATLPLRAAPAASRDAQKDVAFALKELDKKCGHFFRQKGIDWKSVTREFTKAARSVRNREDHYVLIVRLVARLRDGHATARLTEKAGKIPWPLAPKARQSGPGMFWCRSGKKILVKSAWSAAADSGVKPGMQVITVDKLPVEKWLEQHIAARRDIAGYSTDHQAFYAICHWGLAGDQGSPMPIELRTVDGKRKKATITRRRASVVPVGPVFPPEGLKSIGRQSYGKTAAGFGYIHLRDVPGELPTQLDTMLAALGDVPGLILDCRANGGGGVDHAAVFGRFVPGGKTWGHYRSAGPNPYVGPMVVIVDAGVRSAGETIAGQFKEDGRAYMIGESSTAGMSSSKTTIPVPSGLFNLYVSVNSNKKRFNGGRGIEGIGVPPHEIVPYDPGDLAKGVDTQIVRAEALLADFSKVQGQVRYRPPKR